MNQAKIKAKVKNFLSSANEPGGFQYLDTLDSFENLNDYQYKKYLKMTKKLRTQFSKNFFFQKISGLKYQQHAIAMLECNSLHVL